MNRVYKVIWSKAKHCYVVTSEIARSVTKSASSARSAGRKGAAVLAMAALLFTAGGVLGEAVNVVTDVSGSSAAQNLIIVTKDDGNSTNFSINNVEKAQEADHAKEADYATAATKAYGDGDGLVIKNTYAKKADVEKDLSALDEKINANTVAVAGVVEAGEKVGEKLLDLDKQVKVNADAVAAEATDRKEADKGSLRVNPDGVISKLSNDDGSNPDSVNKLVLNKDDPNQITLSRDGIKVGLNSGVMDKDGFYAGGDDYEHAGAALKWDGSIKGAAGDFTVDTKGKVTAASGKIGTVEITSAGAVSGVTDLTVNGTFDSKTLSSTVDAKDDYTTINGGNVTSEVNDKVGTVDYSAESIFNKDGSSITVRTDEGIVDSTGKSIVGAKEISQYLGDNAKPEGSQKNVTRKMIRNNDGTFSMEDKAVDGTNKYSTVSQNAGERKVTVIDGNNKASTNLSNNGFNTFASDGTNKTYTKQTATDIKNTAEKGMISHTAKNLVNTASENMTNTVGKDLTTTVGGDSSLTAENITNEAKNKITNKALDVETDAASSIVSKVSNDYGSNTSTQLSHQTMEEMKAEGKTASYLRGAAEEKSQLTDGAKKTTIDTVAGQTNTNITEGKNVSNSLQKADQIASSVTDGTNTTVVNQNAGSLASSITDGTKANNTSSTVDKSEQLIKVDNTHFYAETKTAGSAVEALKSDGNTIISAKDAVTGTVSSAVTDGATITGISQNAKDISLSAAGGTITNDANDVLNKGANSVINKVGDNQVAVTTKSVEAAYGLDTYTTWDDKGITSNTSGNMSNSATNITNKADEKLSNSAADIENKASSSIWNHVGKGYNTSWKMTDGKISESIVNGTASNKENTTAEGTKRIITSEEGTGTYNQTATSNNISLKNKAGDTSFTKSESLKGEKTSVTNPNGSSTINQSAESIVNFVKNSEGHTTKTEQSATDITNTAKDGTIYNKSKDILNEASGDIINWADGEIGNVATKITNITGKNTVISDNDGTTFENEDAKTPFVKGGEVNTKITGNKVETGKVLTDDLTVRGTSEFVGRADFRNEVYVDENLTVAKETRTDTLYVDHDGYVGGNLYVEGNIETHDAVLSADSRQVVTGRQLYQTNERVDRLDNRIKKVGANAAALAALRPGDFNPDDKFSIAAGFGSYRNANAAALGLFYRPNENVLLSLGTSFGDGENMVNAGVSVKFGRGKSMAERRKEMADEVSSMRDEMRSQDERIAELEEMLKKQSELIEKLSKES
ncbi:ESPR-type extended signal peptide-containing protein [Dialister succinatiphilus]|uniref:ESPR-type extended signal peptide-containing protein n=1 Tax=Dialister succinatiphilus TaxID=487173 RepID=UPI0023565870|nr:ESPR-type extended signal peptide-containing protein [Dialister succinatiphilus]